jgi:hypothetical protein
LSHGEGSQQAKLVGASDLQFNQSGRGFVSDSNFYEVMALDEVDARMPVNAVAGEFFGVFHDVIQSFHEAKVNQMCLKRNGQKAIMDWQGVLYLQFWLMQLRRKTPGIRSRKTWSLDLRARLPTFLRAGPERSSLGEDEVPEALFCGGKGGKCVHRAAEKHGINAFELKFYPCNPRFIARINRNFVCGCSRFNAASFTCYYRSTRHFSGILFGEQLAHARKVEQGASKVKWEHSNLAGWSSSGDSAHLHQSEAASNALPCHDAMRDWNT